MRLRRTPGRVNSVQKHSDKRMLLVEDSRMFATALKYGLESVHGIRVTHCSSLAALKETLEQAPESFSLAVLDLNLPDAEGVEGVLALRRAVGALPLAVISADLEPELVSAAMGAGASGYVG